MKHNIRNNNGQKSQESLPEALQKAGRRNPFVVPEGYFETLPDRVLNTIENDTLTPETPVISIFSRRLRAVAASVAILLFSGLTYALVTEVIIPSIRSKNITPIEVPVEQDANRPVHAGEHSESPQTSDDETPGISSGNGLPAVVSQGSQTPGSLPFFPGVKPTSNRAERTGSTAIQPGNNASRILIPVLPGSGNLSEMTISTHKGQNFAQFTDTIVCRGTTLRYQVDFSPADHQFVWHLNGKVTERCTGPSMEVYTGTLPYGTQRVSLVVTSLKTKQVVSVQNAAIQVVESPESRGTREVCSYDKATLQGGPLHPHREYFWSTGARTPGIEVTQSGTYWVTIRLRGGNCQVTDTFHVQVMPKPSFALGTERIVCAGDVLNLSVTDPSNHYQIRWLPGNSTSTDYQFTQSTPGLYRVTVKVTGCEVHTAEVRVKVNDCRLAIPNVFTPNGDGINDLFVIAGLEAYPGSVLVVTDRNGRVVYENKEYDNSWNGQDLPEATYFYTFIPGGQPELARKGTVNIRR